MGAEDAPPPPQKKGLSANWAVTEVDHLISALGRYTHFVLLSKMFLALLVLGLVVALIGVPLLSKDRSGIRVSFIDNGVHKSKDAARPVMSRPKYRGINDRGEQYTVRGIRATQETQNRILIEQVDAELNTLKGGWRHLTSDRANYHQETKIIELTGNVTLTDDQGYSFLSQQATVDAKTSRVVGNEPVSGRGPLGNILASGFEIIDNGSHIIFTGEDEPVRVHIDRKKK